MRTLSMLRSRFTSRSKSLVVTAAALLAAGLVAVPAASPALAVPAGFADTLVATLAQPTAVKVLPGGDLLVLEKTGTFRRVAADGSVSAAGTIDVCADGERGLLERGARSGVRHDGHDLRLRDAPARRCVHQHALEVHDERRRASCPRPRWC